MSHILRTVASDYTTVRLNLHNAGVIDWLPEASAIPLPASVKTLSGFVDLPGEDMASEHYPNMVMRLAFYVKGSSADDFNDKVNSLAEEFAKERILELRPEGATTSVFYRTLPTDVADPAQAHHPLWRMSYHAHGVFFEFQVKPWCETAEQTLYLINNEVLNPGFETRSGDDFTNWTETEVNGSGVSTVEAVTTATYVLNGSVCVHLKTTAANGQAVITSDYITIDKTKHYYIQAPVHKNSVNTLIQVKVYNSSNTLLETLAISQHTSFTDVEFKLGCAVIHPSGETTETLYWNANAAKVKLVGLIYNAIGEGWIDNFLLTKADYIEEAAYEDSTANPYRIAQMFGFRLPAADIKGTMPSPMRVKISKPLSPVVDKLLLGIASEYKEPVSGNASRCLLLQDTAIAGAGTESVPSNGYLLIASGNYLVVGHFNDSNSDLVKVKLTSLAIKDGATTIRTIDIDDIEFTEVDWTLAEPDTASPKRTVDLPPFTSPYGTDPDLLYYYTLGSDGTSGSWYVFGVGLIPTHQFARIEPTEEYSWIDCYRGNAIGYSAASDDITKAVALAPSAYNGNCLEMNPDGVLGAIALICEKGNAFANHVFSLPDVLSISYRPRYHFPVGT